MSSVEILSGNLNRLLHRSTSPVGQEVQRLAKRVARRAEVNARAAGFRPAFLRGHPAPTPYMRSQDLANNLDAYGPFNSPRGDYWHVGSRASHQGISYPALVERGGISRSGKAYRYPYLEPALAPDFVRGG